MNPLIYALTRLAASERLHPTFRAEMARQLVKLDPAQKPPVSSSLTAEPRQPLYSIGPSGIGGEYQREGAD